MSRIKGQLPTPGQLIGCKFPHEEDPTSPGAKFRPCLVAGVDNDIANEHPLIAVVYGTAQRTGDKNGKPLKAHEFELEARENGIQLPEQTRFDCSRWVYLPFTEEWFGSEVNKTLCKIYGPIHANRMEEVRAAVAAGRQLSL